MQPSIGPQLGIHVIADVKRLLGHPVTAVVEGDLAAVIEHTVLDRPVLVASSYGGFIVCDYLRVYGAQTVAGINLAGAAVMMSPRFDHIGPGFLDHAPAACVSDLPTNIAAIQRFLRACTAEPLSLAEWSTALCWNMVVPRRYVER